MKLNRKINTEITYDIIIVGGGITGAGIIREAADRGYNVLLVDKQDFGSGTSSKSSKLIHGGLRYLQYAKFGLVREALHEREHLLKEFGHIVKPMPFVLPIYKGFFKFRVGMILYKLLTGKSSMPSYQKLSREEILAEFPEINPKGLKGGFKYYDALTNDARLTNESIALAERTETIHAENYMEFSSYENKDDSVEVELTDIISKEKCKVKAKFLINAGGVWVDSILQLMKAKKTNFVEASKGIHLIFKKDKIKIDKTIAFPSAENDGRLLFLIPWEDKIVVGTTDTKYVGNYDKILTEKEEADYILNAVNYFAPDLNLEQKDIIGSFAGVRPLLKQEGVETKDASREYEIWWSDKRSISILGGKLTSFQSMAKEVLNKISENKNSFSEITKQDNKKYDFPSTFIQRIEAQYGMFAHDIFELVEAESDFLPIHENFSVSKAEIKFFIRKLNSKNITDLLFRRLSLGYSWNTIRNNELYLEKILDIFSDEFDLSEEQRKIQKNEFLLSVMEMTKF